MYQFLLSRPSTSDQEELIHSLQHFIFLLLSWPLYNVVFLREFIVIYKLWFWLLEYTLFLCHFFFLCKPCPHVVLLHFISDKLYINLGVGYPCSFSQLARKSRHWGLVIFPMCIPSDFRRKMYNMPLKSRCY